MGVFSKSSFVLALGIFTKTILDCFNYQSFAITLYKNNWRENKMKKGTANLQKLLKSRKSKTIIYEKPNIRYSSRFVDTNINE